MQNIYFRWRIYFLALVIYSSAINRTKQNAVEGEAARSPAGCQVADVVQFFNSPVCGGAALKEVQGNMSFDAV